MNGGKLVVYCPRCGTKNPDKAKKCKKCGNNLFPYYLEKRVEQEVESCFGPRKREKYVDECFGVPRGLTIFAILFGGMLIVIGVICLLGTLFEWSVQIWKTFWPLVFIILGLLIFLGALFELSRLD